MGLLFPRQPEAETVTIKTSREFFFLASPPPLPQHHNTWFSTTTAEVLDLKGI
jgi:hypothetical protein